MSTLVALSQAEQLILVLFVALLAGCVSKPSAGSDPAYIAAHMGENLHWQALGRDTGKGMTRAEIERILPPNRSLRGPIGMGHWKSSPQPHTEEWYYVSPHFICSVDYDLTGQENPTDGIGDNSNVDDSENVALSKPTITLVEPNRVKKP
jgi:hypothetical protein